MGTLEGMAMERAGADYRRRLSMLWGFMARWRLKAKPPEALDKALTDYCDTAYLGGESCEHGDKLKAAMVSVHPDLMPPGIVMHPHFARTLKGWRRASPTWSRVGHPEGVTYSICAKLFGYMEPHMALSNAALCRTRVMPIALINMLRDDVIAPPPACAQLPHTWWCSDRPKSGRGGPRPGSAMLH